MLADPRVLLSDIDQAGADIERFIEGRPDDPSVTGYPFGKIDFRNLLIHGYASVMPERVWDNAENHLPELRRIVQALLVDLGPPDERTPSVCSRSTNEWPRRSPANVPRSRSSSLRLFPS